MHFHEDHNDWKYRAGLLLHRENLAPPIDQRPFESVHTRRDASNNGHF